MLNCYVYDDEEIALLDIGMPEPEIDFEHGPTEKRWFFMISSVHEHADNPLATVVCGPGFEPVVVKENLVEVINMMYEAR